MISAVKQIGSKSESPYQGLSVRGISKSYGGVEVLSAVDLDVRPGEVVALLGENGAGKSTLSSIIAGVVKPSSGQMTWQGRAYQPSLPIDARDAGIGLIHQEMRLLPELSIAENVFVGRLPRRGGRIDRAAMNQRARAQLQRLGLDVAPTRLVKTLQIAAQQQVEIAKALTLDAKLLILDEPTAALGGDETDRLFERIKALKSEGVSFIYISHRLEEIARVADRIAVLRDGHLIATHDNAKASVQVLVEQMVGRKVEKLFPSFSTPKEKVVLEVTKLTAQSGTFKNISFSVRQGEVFGLAGIVGAGRTEVVRAIAGADPLASGSVAVNGQILKLTGTRDAIEAGIVLVPEDRKAQGLIVSHTLMDNITIGNHDLFAKGGWVWPRKAQSFAQKAITQMGVKGQPDQHVSALSGGNQQKVVIGKWLARNAKVFILDEPTRGIDVGARAAIYEVIRELAEAGMAVVLVSSDLEEVIGLSHRVLVLSLGEQQGLLEGDEINQVAVMKLAAK